MFAISNKQPELSRKHVTPVCVQIKLYLHGP